MASINKDQKNKEKTSHVNLKLKKIAINDIKKILLKINC